MSVENLPPLKRETILPSSDRGRVATLVAMCSLAGVAVGFGLSTAAMQAASDASRSVMITDVRSMPSDHVPATEDTPWLGITFRTGCHGGAVISQVTPSSPAAAVGLHVGDVVVGYEHAQVHSSGELFRLVRASSIGDHPAIEVLRNGRGVEVQPTLAQVPRALR